ncbi:MAG: PDZ domain-containing protein, partial [Candidatus Omnitrophica bacterium]|nr:PDZ domain-containing protein [Candidatus Omnitrophota bacterium]
PYAVLGNSDDVKPGQWAISIGNPFGFAAKNPKPAVTLGIISTVHRSLPHASGRDRAYSDLIQTDAAINPGNSGGPLVTINAEVVGINAAIVGTGGGSLGIGFAIPVNNAKAILNKLLKGEEVLSGWFGIAVQDLNQALADYFRLRTSQGVLVISVIPDSPADKSGIQPEDAIIKFDEVIVQNTLELLRLLGKKNTGDIVKIKIMRNGLPRTLKVTLGKQPDRDNAAEIGVRNESPASEESAAPPEVTELKSWRGLSVAAITAENAGNLNLPDDKGVIVTEVSAESGAERAGCKVNDIITQVNTIMIGSLSDYIRAVANADGNVLIKTNRGYLMIPE